MFGTCIEGVSNVFERCLEVVLNVPGRNPEGVWKVSGSYLEKSGSCVEGFWKMIKNCLFLEFQSCFLAMILSINRSTD